MRPRLRILVVKLSSLGDVAHAVPSVAALALLHPGAEIDWLVEPLAAPFVAELPWVSDTLILDLPAALARGVAGVASERSRVAALLKARRYDLVVDLQGLLRSSLWTLWSGAGRRAGRARWPWLDVGVSMYDHERTPHAVENTARVVEALGGSAASGWVEALRGLSPLAARLRARGAEMADALGLPGEFAAGFPMATSEAKSLPPGWLERWPGPPLVLLGDARLAAYRPESRGVVNLAGSLPLLDSLALALAATRVVSADTGPGHVAALLGANVTSILGPTSVARVGARGSRARSVAGPCGGCERRRCPKAAKCLAAAFAAAANAG
jgi:ADP-heptose:LPS heptosyltransferase